MWKKAALVKVTDCDITCDIMEICGKANIPGYLVTMDLEKAFDSLVHDFLLCILKKFGFGKILLNDQQSCVINGGFTTQYFTLKRCAC